MAYPRTESQRAAIRMEKAARDWRLMTTVSANTVLGCIAPMTADSYRNIMTIAASRLSAFLPEPA